MEAAKGLPTQKDGSGVLMSFPQSGGVPRDFIEKTPLWFAVQEIYNILNRGTNYGKSRVLHVMVNTLPPGCVCPVHTDTVLYNPIRVHLPLVTNPDCFFWDEINHFTIMEAGYWYGPVLYGKNHTIGNFGDTNRIHLIADLEPRHGE